MRLDSPILALTALPLLAWIVWRTRTPVRSIARWTLRAAMLLLWICIASLQLRCDRPPVIAVVVDVSPSTRGALLRDPAAVAQRLAPLLNGRPASVHYFADGQRADASEAAVDHTRLEIPKADAVVLLSDGRFDAPVSLPPVFAVVDPSLDAPGDGRVVALSAGEGASVWMRVEGPSRVLRVDGGKPDSFDGVAGDRVMQFEATRAVATATLDAKDRWPENDSLSAVAAPRTAKKWAIGVSVPGARRIEVADFPRTLGEFVGVSSIALPTPSNLSTGDAELLRKYVDTLGGTLILTGPPAEAPPSLRAIAPLSATPPSAGGQWVILLDASGSMAQDGKWKASLDAAARAVAVLPSNAAISLLTFNRQTQIVVDHGSPAAVVASLHDLAGTSPTGPTGLRAAIDSVCADQAGPTRILLVSDGDAALGDTIALSETLRQNDVRILALLTAPSPPLQTLAEATGGTAITQSQPAAWPATLARLAAAAQSRQADVVAPIAAKGVLSGRFLHARHRWDAWPRDSATVLAAERDATVAAVQQVGLGQMLSIAADVTDDDLAAIADRVPGMADDPRFAVTLTDNQRTLRVTAAENGRPMNGLHVTLGRGTTSATLDQTAPGEYTAPLATMTEASVALVAVDGKIVARHAIAGRYAREFDAIGNDRAALAALAERTGGRLIEPGDNRPLEISDNTQWRSFGAAATATGMLIGLIGLLLLRMPYFEDRLRSRFSKLLRRPARG